MRTLVIGAGGLLGRAVVAAVDRRSDLVRVDGPGIPWSSRDEARDRLASAARRLVGISGARWQVIWCAGAGVNGTSTAQFAAELEYFRGFLSQLATFGDASLGRVFLASSAGGVFAGSAHPPFDETSPTSPLSDYGTAKLATEDAVAGFALSSGVRVLIGRFSNLYGPGQNLAKQQGLISHLCLSAITRKPISIFVPLDTIRDYLYIEDAANMVLDAMETLHGIRETSTMKIFASQRGTTIATLLDAVSARSGTRPPVILGSSPLSAFQSKDLRLRSRALMQVDRRQLTPLTVGIARTWASLLGLYLQHGRVTG